METRRRPGARGIVAGGAAGVRRLEARAARPRRVLAYHSVGGEADPPAGLAVSAAHFAEHLAVLREFASVVPVGEELAESRHRLPRGRAMVGLTLDDGYADNLLTAVPLLERFDLPATVFVSTGCLDQPYFWWDQLARLTRLAAVGVEAIVTAATELRLLPLDGAVGQGDDRDEVERALRHAIADVPAPGRIGLVAELTARLAPGTGPDRRPLTRDELAVLAAHPLVRIGGHGHHHAKLPSVDPLVAREDVERGLDVLRSVTGVRPVVFAYPHGACDPAVRSAVADAGIKVAFTTESRTLSVLDHPLRLPRIDPGDVDGDVFRRARRLGPGR